MYLFIFEDGLLGVSDSLTEDDLQAVDDGYFDIVRIDLPHPVHYYKNEWHDVEKTKE